MKRIIWSMHVSLDGYVATAEGGMDWIQVDDELFRFVADMTDDADTALYGRKTYEIMEAYWPTADKQANASEHDIRHAQWYRRVKKVVISGTMRYRMIANTRVVSENLAGEISRLKTEAGGSIIIFGSPSAVQPLIREQVIDDYWLFIYPVVIGGGIPLFENGQHLHLELKETRKFPSGIMGLHYVQK